MGVFEVKLYDSSEVLIATLSNATRTKIVREINHPPLIEFYLPRNDSNKSNLALNNIIKVYDRSSNLLAEGFIVGPLDTSQDPIKVIAFGYAAKLGWIRTPYKWDGVGTPVDVLRALLYWHKWIRYTTYTDWNNGTASSTTYNSDASGGDEDYFLLLQKDSNGNYYSSGTWTSPVIDFGQSVSSWGRIRFKQFKGDTTEVEYATQSSTDNIIWSGYSAWASLTDSEAGATISNAAGQYLQVKFRLTSTDQKYSPVVHSFEVTGKIPSGITEGTGFASLPSDTIYLEPSYKTHLEVIQEMMKELDWEWEVDDALALNVSNQFGTDLSLSKTLTEGTDTNVLQYAEDDSNLYNRVVGTGSGSGIDQLVSIQEDPTSISSYQQRETMVKFSDVTDQTDLDSLTQDYLTKHKDPVYKIRVQHVSFGETYKAGDIINFVSPASWQNINTNLRIQREERRETDGGEVVLLDLVSTTLKRDEDPRDFGRGYVLSRRPGANDIDKPDYLREYQKDEGVENRVQGGVQVEHSSGTITAVTNTSWDNVSRQGIDTGYVVLPESSAYVLDVTDQATPTSSIDVTTAEARIQLDGSGIVVPYNTGDGTGCYVQVRRASGTATLDVTFGALMVGYER